MTEFQALKIANKYGDVRGGGPVSTSVSFTGEGLQQFVSAILATRDAAPIVDAQARDDTGRLTSDYEPTAREISVARDAICREFGNNGTDGYYIRILKAIHGAMPALSEELDARRYRWLRDPDVDVALVIDKVTGDVPTTEGLAGGGYKLYEYRAGEELDAAIDNAIAASAPRDK